MTTPSDDSPALPPAIPAADVSLQRLLEQAAETDWLPFDISPARREARRAATRALQEALEAADGMERLIATQMVAAHNVAMDCMRRAMQPGRQPTERHIEVSHGLRLFAVATRQSDRLDKHRLGAGPARPAAARPTATRPASVPTNPTAPDPAPAGSDTAPDRPIGEIPPGYKGPIKVIWETGPAPEHDWQRSKGPNSHGPNGERTRVKRTRVKRPGPERTRR